MGTNTGEIAVMYRSLPKRRIVPQLLRAGICVGLGTDGCSSNNNLDLLAEMDTAAKLHKVNTFDPTVTDALSVLQMTTSKCCQRPGIV